MDRTKSKGVAMKATLKWLAVMLVSTLTLNAASAQEPYQLVPAGYGYPPEAAAEYTSNYGGKAHGCADGNCGSGGCASGKCGSGGCGKWGSGGCGKCGGGSCAKQILQYLCCAGCAGCQKPELFKKKHDCGCKCSALKSWLCKPCPSDAPVLWHAQYPLGFKTHPYARSPRDYFMWNDP
jgi:hypothetical protein